MPQPDDPRPPASRVARNTALRAAAEVVGKLASVVLFAYIARSLGQDALGDFVFALALVQIVWSLAGFGLDRMALRDISREREAGIDRLFYDVTGFKFVAGIAGVALATGGVALAGYSGRVQALVAILGLSLVLVLLSSSAQTVFQAYERMEYYFYAAVPNKILAALLGILVLALGAGLIGVALANLAASVVGLVLATSILFRRFRRPAVTLQPRRWHVLARQSGPFGLQEVLGQIFFRLDIVMLSVLTTNALVGQYGAAYRLVEATLFLAWSVGTSVLPMYSYLERDSEPSLVAVLRGSLKFTTALMVPLAVGLVVCARPIVDLIYGLPAYEGSITILRLLGFSVLAYAIGHLAGIFVLVRRPGRVTVYAVGAVIAVKLALSAVLIETLDARGAAIATLAAEVVLAAVSLYLTRVVVGAVGIGRVVTTPLVSGAAMAAAMFPFRDELVIAVPLGAVVYLGVLALLEARSLTGDLSAVRSALGRSPRPAP